MTTKIVHTDTGRILLRVSCDGCHRSVGSDFLTPTELCRLVGWDCDLGAAHCHECQSRRRRQTEMARRARRRQR